MLAENNKHYTATKENRQMLPKPTDKEILDMRNSMG